MISIMHTICILSSFFLKYKSLGMNKSQHIVHTDHFSRMTSSDAILYHLFNRGHRLYLHYALLYLLRHITAIYLFRNSSLVHIFSIFFVLYSIFKSRPHNFAFTQ